MHPPNGSFYVSPNDRPQISPNQPPLIVRMSSWLAAGSLTLTLHVGLYFALTGESQPPPPPSTPPAAVMINMSPIVVSARSETDNDADGPETDEREAIEEMVETPVAAEPPAPPPPEPALDIPPPPPEAKPEAVLPPKPVVKPLEKPSEEKAEKPPEKPKAEKAKVEKSKPKPDKPKKPKPDKPKKIAVKDEPAQKAQKKGGAPKSNQQTGELSSAPSTGGTSVSAVSRADWSSDVRGKIVRAKRYPPAARKKREAGVVKVSVTFDGRGAVTAAKLVASSGSEALDEEALAVMRRVKRFPPPPGGKPATLLIPMNFDLR